jgi:aminomethyltransferase
VYRRAANSYLVVVNAGNTDRVREWLEGRLLPGVQLEDSSRVTSLVALQGPAAQEILQPLCTGPLAESTL